LQEQVWRAEKFALGTLLYELLAGREIFKQEDDAAVQAHYSAASFPNLENLSAPYKHLIYCCWSAEFGRYIALSQFRRYVHDNPFRFALQATSAVTGVAALATIPVLGAIGFGAIGPVAGSVAAGWQAAIGAVEAGSLFALCQSAAMGGVAATGLVAAGATGGAVAAVASTLPDLASLTATFTSRFRRGPRRQGLVRL
jgi:hypothetical protein